MMLSDNVPLPVQARSFKLSGFARPHRAFVEAVRAVDAERLAGQWHTKATDQGTIGTGHAKAVAATAWWRSVAESFAKRQRADS